MGGFNKSQTTKNKTQPSKQGTNFVNSLVNLATKTAKQPLQQYTGPRVAGFTPDQTAGMNAVRSAQGVQTPYINTAAQYAAQGANPITGIPNVGTSNVSWNAIGNPQQVQYNGYTPDQFSAEGLAQFYNPYQQNVIDSTLQNIARADSLQQGDLLGKAISSGASPFGGDRAGLAAAELARGQSMARNQTVAELQNTGYNTALGAFQNQQGLNAQAGMQNASNALTASQQNAANWMAQQQANQNAGLTASQQNAANQLAASQQNAGNALTAAQANQTAAARAAEQFGGLGTQAQQQALTGASALLQTGGLQQQLEQNRIDIPYQQFQEQQQYPQQQAQWLLNTLMGVPATSWGTTSTTQQPGPSGLSQLIGGATSLASLGLGFKRGGVADYADGGAVSYAPAANYGIAIPMLNQNAFAIDQNAGYKGEALPGYTYSEEDYPPIVTRLPKGMRKAIRGIGSAVGAPGQQGAAYGSDAWASQGGPGALIWREIAKGLQGGILGKQNYKKKKAIGGGIGDDEPSFSLNPLGDIRLPQPVGIGAAAMPVEDAEVVAENAPAPRTIRIPTDRPIMTAAAAPPPSALPPEADGFAMPPVPMAGAPEGGDRGASRFSQFLESPMGALFQGSLATMAGESPFAGVNIGRGLLTGVQAFQAAQAAKAQAEGDRDPQVITREDGSVHLLYPDSGETVEVMAALPGTAKRDTTTVNGKLIDTQTGEVVYADDAAPTRNTVVIGDKLVDQESGEVIGDYSGEDVGYMPADAATLAQWGIVAKPGQAWGIGEDGKPVIVYDALAQIADPFERERYLRNDFDKIAQNYRLLKESYAKIETGAKKPSAAGDVALIFSYMRMLDPASTVREGEFATASNAAGVPDIVVNTYNRILTGERLTPEQRADFANTAKGLLGAQFGQFKESAEQFRGLASEYGLNPDRVVPPEMLVDAPSAPPAEEPGAKPSPYSIYAPGLLGPASRIIPPSAPLQPGGTYEWTPDGFIPVSP